MAAHTTVPLLPEGATALEIPSDRPAYYYSFKASGVPAAATAVHLVIPPSEMRTSRPQRMSVYMPDPPPVDQEAAMLRLPFDLDDLDGPTVWRVGNREHSIYFDGGRRFRIEYNYMAHVALHYYPVEQRTEKDIEVNCGQFGFLREVDPACYGAPDLATVHVVLQLEHPREIPHQVRIGYFDGTKNVVPVEVVRIWDRGHSYDADGQYVRLFQAPAAAA